MGSYLTVLSGRSQLPFTDHARRWTEENGVGWRSFLTAYWSDAVTGNWYFKHHFLIIIIIMMKTEKKKLLTTPAPDWTHTVTSNNSRTFKRHGLLLSPHNSGATGHCLSDSVQHSSWKSNCAVHKSLGGNGEGTAPPQLTLPLPGSGGGPRYLRSFSGGFRGWAFHSLAPFPLCPRP